MSEDFVLNATSRGDTGKGASRRLRRLADQVPGIVYGGRKKPVNISINQKEFYKQLESEAFYSHIISLVIDDKAENVILKDLQRHPAKGYLVHADFLRVSKTKKLNTNVPLHFINEESGPGVKLNGGKVVHNMVQLEVSCLPADLPEYIEVDLGEAEVGDVIHISDLKLPKGVSAVALTHGEDHDQPVVTVNKKKGATADDESEDGEEASDEESGDE